MRIPFSGFYGFSVKALFVCPYKDANAGKPYPVFSRLNPFIVVYKRLKTDKCS